MPSLIRAIPVPVAATNATESFELNFEAYALHAYVESVSGWRSAPNTPAGAVAVVWVRDMVPGDLDLATAPRTHKMAVVGVRWHQETDGGQVLPDGVTEMVGHFSSAGETWLVFRRGRAPEPAHGVASAPRTPATPESPRAPAPASRQGDVVIRDPGPAAPAAARLAATPGTARPSAGSPESAPRGSAPGPTPRPHSGPAPTRRPERK